MAAGCLIAAGPDFRPALPGYHYQFPRDHFSHPDFQTEWWYYTGNVHSPDGHRYGFELVFFRQGQPRGPEDTPSVWRADDLYLAHLALSDLDARRHTYYSRLNRAGPGIAGISLEQHRIWNGNWESVWDQAYGVQTLKAVARDIRFELRLTPRKSLVINGENEVSQKAAAPGRASYYVSFTRMAVEGVLNGASVTGGAWMDHEWSTHPLDAEEVGWDWFSIQLENNTELMFFQLRRSDGTIDPYSSGTYVAADGHATHLKRADFQLEPLEFWRSPKTQGRYPIRWRITMPSLHLSLECTAAFPDQELSSDDIGGNVYWEGATTYSGSSSGVGYLEMTGYSTPVRL